MSGEPETQNTSVSSGLFFTSTAPECPARPARPARSARSAQPAGPARSARSARSAQYSDFADDENDSDDIEDIPHSTPVTPSEYKAVKHSAHKPSSSKPNQSKKRSAVEEVGDVITPKKPKKRARVAGGRAPTSKRIVPDYDSEDQIIVDMKQQGYHDEDVAKRLVEEGRTRYDPKSISSRWQRIRKAIQAAEDELLDEELTDWHEGEDDLLRDAYIRGNARMTEELERVRQKQYNYIAQELNKHAARPRFSARACQERYEALQNGTARCPPELDEDPDARRRERDERIVAFRVRKAEERKQREIDEAEAKLAKSKRFQAKEMNRLKQEAAAAAKAAKQKEEDEFKMAKVHAIRERREQRQQALRDARDMRVYLQAKRKCENKLLKRVRKEANARARQLARYSQQFPLPEHALDGIGHGKGRDEAIYKYDFKGELEALNSRDNGMAAPIAGGRPPTAASSLAALANAPANPNVNVFGDDPRTMLTLPELYDLMRDRGMLLNRMKEVKGVVLLRLNNEDAKMRMPELRSELTKRGLTAIGTKAEMIRRIQEDDAKQSSGYKRRFGPKPPKTDKKTLGSSRKQNMPAEPVLAKPRFTAKTTPSRRGRYNARKVNANANANTNSVMTNAGQKPGTNKALTSNGMGSSVRLAMIKSRAEIQATAQPSSSGTGRTMVFDDDAHMSDADNGNATHNGGAKGEEARHVGDEKGDGIEDGDDEHDADWEDDS
ncbi:hypothetical protein MBLNU459_g7575t1 [Dothideomycetes sp. NU459]